MKALFCYDGPLKQDQHGRYYGIALNEKMFSRYYVIADYLIVAIRASKIKTTDIESGLSPIKLENFQVVPCANLSTFKGILFERSKVERILYDQIKYVDFLIVRLPSVIGNLSIKIACKLNKPYLVELVGCPWDALWNHSLKGKLVAPFMWYTTKKNIKHAPFVLYVTNEFLQRRYPSHGKTLSCSNVVLTNIEENTLRKRLERIERISKNKPIILGTIAAVNVRYKGQEYVIKAIAELKRQGYNFEYHLVGAGNNAHLKSIADSYGVSDRIKFEGILPHDMIFDYLDNIDIYVQPSKHEGLPRALIEAMSRGCPCIGSNAGGIPELLDHNFVFKKGNVKELVRILHDLNREKMIKQAIRNYEFSKKYAKDVLEASRNKFFKDFADSFYNYQSTHWNKQNVIESN